MSSTVLYAVGLGNVGCVDVLGSWDISCARKLVVQNEPPSGYRSDTNLVQPRL